MSHFPRLQKIHTSSHCLLAMEGHCPTSTETKVVFTVETVNHMGLLAWLSAKTQGPLKHVIVGWLEMLPTK